MLNAQKIGFGTYPLKNDICTKAVSEALRLGYRMIDTATYYDNFEAIAEAIKMADRNDVILVSKVWHDSQTREGIERDISSTLKKLKTDYLDIYLIHWPNSKVSITETLTTMNELRMEGKIREIGMSNVTVNHLNRALEVGVPLSWVQIEMHPDFCDDELISFCDEKKINMQAWRPINKGEIVNDPMLIQIGKKYGKSPVQIALRWIIQKQVIPLPGSSNPAHIADNFDVFEFNLDEDDMNKISLRASSGDRFRLKLEYGLGFEDEFDYSYEQCWPL